MNVVGSLAVAGKQQGPNKGTQNSHHNRHKDHGSQRVAVHDSEKQRQDCNKVTAGWKERNRQVDEINVDLLPPHTTITTSVTPGHLTGDGHHHARDDRSHQAPVRPGANHHHKDDHKKAHEQVETRRAQLAERHQNSDRHARVVPQRLAGGGGFADDAPWSVACSLSPNIKPQRSRNGDTSTTHPLLNHDGRHHLPATRTPRP